MVKVGDLLAENEVLQQRRASLTSRQDFLVLDGAADVRGQEALGVIDLKLGEVVSRNTLSSGGEVAHVGKGTLGCGQASKANGGGQ